MAHVDYACAGALLFRTELGGHGGQVIPRVGEAVVVDDAPYQVVDVEYWARRLGEASRRACIPTVHLIPISPTDWEQRLQRRKLRDAVQDAPPVRY